MTIQNAREKILQTAVKIFAEKSFEGSRIDEIAREANVTKSLIYYHFKSKDEILEVLTNNFIDEYTNLIEKTLHESHSDKAQNLPNRMKNVYYDFGKKNEDLLRVMLIDSLKKSKETPILFKVIEVITKNEKKKDENYNVHERQIAEFFTSFIPNYAYICFADSWTKYFNINRSEFDKLYLEIYTETHGAYHKNHP